MKVIPLERIQAVLPGIDVIGEVARGFAAYSEGRAVVPPVGELVFEKPPGDVHIKYGYIRGEEHYVIKIASGFFDNPKRGLPSGNGMMLVFRKATGEPEAVLLDEGHLTDIRTAAAGAVAARHLAPEPVQRIGILGTGAQARLQLEYLGKVTECREALVWGRSPDAVARYRQDMAARGFSVAAATAPGDVAAACNVIVTTTPSTEPLLVRDQIRPGTHITAMGSDTAGKQELDAGILAAADLVVADSIVQCRERGEIAHALRAGLDEGSIVELGTIVSGGAPGRSSAKQITVADLTGVAVQDIRIAVAVCAASGHSS